MSMDENSEFIKDIIQSIENLVENRNSPIGVVYTLTSKTGATAKIVVIREEAIDHAMDESFQNGILAAFQQHMGVKH